MDIKFARKLAELMHTEGLNIVEIANEEGTIKLERGTGGVIFKRESAPNKDRVKKVAEKNCERSATAGERGAPAGNKSADKKETSAPKKPTIFEIRSPVGGMFHSSPVLGGIPLVSVGAEVGIGDVLCIIQDGEQTNEITSDVAGTIETIYVKNGDTISFDQVMFRIVSL